MEKYISAFQNIYTSNFEPFFFPALLAVVWYIRKNRSDAKWNFLAWLILWMTAVRLVFKIYSSRYAAGLVPLTIVFFVLFCREFYLESGRRGWYWCRTLLLLLLAAAFSIGLWRSVKTDRKSRRFASLVQVIRETPGEKKHIIDQTFSASRFRHYLPDIAVSNAERKLSNLKTVLDDAILNGEVFFIYVNRKNEESLRSRIAEIYPELKLEKIHAGKRDVLFRFYDTTGLRGKATEKADLQTSLENSGAYFFEDFEKPVRIDTDKTNWAKVLKKLGLRTEIGKHWDFSDKIYYNTATDFGKGGALELTDGSMTIAGRHSLLCDTPNWAMLKSKCILRSGEKYRGELLYCGEPGSWFKLEIVCFNKSRCLGTKDLQKFGCAGNSVRKAVWQVSDKDFLPCSTHGELCITLVKNKIIIDNIKVEKTQ